MKALIAILAVAAVLWLMLARRGGGDDDRWRRPPRVPLPRPAPGARRPAPRRAAPADAGGEGKGTNHGAEGD